MNAENKNWINIMGKKMCPNRIKLGFVSQVVADFGFSLHF